MPMCVCIYLSSIFRYFRLFMIQNQSHAFHFISAFAFVQMIQNLEAAESNANKIENTLQRLNI